LISWRTNRQRGEPSTVKACSNNKNEAHVIWTYTLTLYKFRL